MIISDSIQNNNYKFYCEKCHYGCMKSSDFKKHQQSIKHKRNDHDNITNFVCICGKKYKHLPGLSRHKKNCETIQESNRVSEKNTIRNLIKENTELKKKMMEMYDQIVNIRCANKTVSAKNKTFNINLFLDKRPDTLD